MYITIVCVTSITTESAVATVLQSVRALAWHAKGWVFKSQPRQTLVVKTGNDSSNDKRLV